MNPEARCPLARRLSAALPVAALLVLAASARAEGPVGGEEEDAMAKVKEISIRISKGLRENEEALARIARGEQASLKPVDISLPKHNHPEGGT